MDAALKSVLEWWDIVGVEVPEIKPAPRAKPTPIKRMAAAAAPKAPEPPKPPPNSEKIAQGAKTLEDLRTRISDFDAGLISDHAKQSVFARGNPQADIMVIGEAPGREEDMTGKPFAGKPGQLLDKMLAAINLSEETAYITNVVNWRPPKDRTPNADEIALCLPFIHKHIALVDPKFILIVGNISLGALTGETGITKQRGQWKDITVGGRTYPALPIYHPSFLLQQPSLKRDAWRDLLALQARLQTAE